MSRLRVLAAAAGAAALVALTPGVASATDGVKLTTDCVTVNEDGSYTAVFGYDSVYQKFSLPVGSTKYQGNTYVNTVTPKQYEGAQPTTFYNGAHRAAFTVKFQPADTVTWTMSYDPNGNDAGGAITATATKDSPKCTTGPALPGEGNGMGSLLVLVGSSVITLVVYAFRRRSRQA